MVVLRFTEEANKTVRLIVPQKADIEGLANRRLGEVGGNSSIIAINGHGNGAGPSPIKTWFSDLWGTFAQHPLVFAFSCLTGNYEDRWCLDYTFGDALMEHGAAVFIGATEVSGGNENTPAMKGFFESHWDPDTTLAGKAFAQYERLRADDGIRWRFWVVEYNYYGDPKFGAASIPVRAVAETATAAAAEQAPPPTTLQVHVPMYQVENADGIDVVSLEGGEWTSEDNRPQVPMYPVVVAVPMGYELQDVQMTSRGSLYSTEGLSLSFNVPITDGGSLDEALVALARAESEGWYPEQAYSWMVRQEGDGSSSLLLTLYPFQYNALTTGVRFYQDMTFSLGYTVPAVTITHLSTDRISYEPGDVVTVSIGLRVSETPTDGYVEAAIYTLAGDYVDGLLVQALPGLTGAAELSPVWNSKGSQAGMYVVRAKVINGAGELQDEDSCSFRLGTVGAEVTLLSAAPNVLTSGQSTYITVQARNTGTTALDGSLTIDVRQGSLVVSSEERTFTGLGPGLSTPWGVSWSSEGNAPGSYVATGAVRYEGAAHSKSAEITVRGAHSLVLPLVIKR
ncbi:MAG TPA: C25 family cysteine peptidase, partial [Anaerolineae bacterium]|nr:C25 family cysteine peptidase [Anaerolineae bacterium]